MIYSYSAKKVALASTSGMVLAGLISTAAHAQNVAPQSTATAAEAAAASDPAANSGIGDIVVTAQRRSESLQTVPIAITAFSQKGLQDQRIETGAELVRGIPNVNFSKGFYGFNFQIRGVGTQLGTVSGDAGVGIHLNNVPLLISRFFEAQFFDVERVEVLRGPQGTLYGRNATGGVVNVVTAPPTGRFEGMLQGEIGTYGSYRGQAMINVPLAGDRLALRVAGSYLKRDGFGINTYTGNKVNGRDLWSSRVSLRAEPVDGLEANFTWQHFEEDDSRSPRNGTLCVKDNGPASVGGVAVTNAIIRGYLSQGCDQTKSIYDPGANGTPNSLGTINGYIAQVGGLTNGDYFAGQTVSRNLNDHDSVRDPRYKAKDDIFIFNLGMQFTPSLKATSITSYGKDSVNSAREFQGAVPRIAFASTALTPGGFYTDPLLGRLNTLGTDETFAQHAKTYTQEFRLDSSFKGPFNFSVGGIFIDHRNTQDVYTQTNLFTFYSDFLNTNTFGVPNCALGATNCIYIEPSPSYQGVGHNYFLSRSPYHLESIAAFGEVYFNATDRLKLTLGGRYSSDTKSQLVIPVKLLALGSGLPLGDVPVVQINNQEPTGRFAVDWKPDLGFTDDTLIYGVLSHGYKPGGFNPPASFTARPPYAPETIDAIEFGIKNTLLDRRMTFNLTYFNYDYKNYQVAEIRDRTQQIQNINSRVSGLEFESTLTPIDGLKFNVAAGYMKTRIKGGAFVDPTNVTGGDPTLTLVRGANASTCSVNTAALAAYLATNPTPQAFVTSVCAGRVPGIVPNLIGVTTSLVGKELPNSPHWTVSAGAEFTARFGGGWRATLRGDYYWQDSSFARTYNRTSDFLRGYENVNTTLTIANDASGWEAQAFVKNVFNTQPITNTFVSDQIVGVPRVGFVTDPRIIGLTLTKRFGS